MKSGTFPRGAFDVDDPAVVIANTLDDGKPDAQTLALCRTPEEALVQERHIKWLDAYAGIGDRQAARAEIHTDETTFGILHRITQQIHKRGMQCLPVQRKNGFWLYRNLEIEALAVNLRAYGLHRIVNALREGDRLHDTQRLLAREKKQGL